MMRILFFFLIISSAYSMTETFQRMRPDKAYMSLALSKYIEWHEKNFSSPWTTADQATKDFLKRSLVHLDHWLVADMKEYPQISFGHISEGNMMLQTVQIYLFPAMRDDSFIKSANLPKKFSPLFFEVNDLQEKCFMGKEEDRPGLIIYCRQKNGNQYVLSGSEIVSHEIHPEWPNPLPFLGRWEIRRLDREGKIISIQYFGRTAHPSLTPRGLDLVINLHVIEAHMSLDRHSIRADKSMMVFFP